MVRLPKYPLVMADDCFSEEDAKKLSSAHIVLYYAIFNRQLYNELKMLTNDFVNTLTLVPDYPRKGDDLEMYKGIARIYNSHLTGRYEDMSPLEAFDFLSNLLQSKTLYLTGDIDLYVWKSKKDIHFWNTSSTHVQHVSYHKIDDYIGYIVPQ